MSERKKYLLGVMCVMLYILIASTQSVALNIWLYDVNVFMIVGLSFCIVTLLFLAIGFVTQRNAYKIILSQWRLLLLLNIVSLFNWLFYFLAVKYLEPSVAVTLTQGLGPVSMTIYYLLTKQFVSRITKYCHILIFIVAMCMCIYTVYFRSEYSQYSQREVIIGIIIATLCSISITFTILISKKFAVSKIPAAVLLSLRFPLLIVVCLSLLTFQSVLNIDTNTIFAILLIALIGVAASIYFLQKGIELAPSLAVSTALALSPLAVFLIQLFNTKIPFSLVLFTMIMLIVTCSIISILNDARLVKS